LDKTAVALGMQFKEMLPTLWMKAGAHGKCPTVDDDSKDMMILPENRMAILIHENAFSKFEAELQNQPLIDTVFIITDYESNYRAMIKKLSVKNTYQLYRDYLDNFRINHGRN
jgi:adenine-specific DNA-methyltransferase